VKKKIIILWKKQRKAGEGDWVREFYWQDAEPSGASTPPTTPLVQVRAIRLRIGLRCGRKTTHRLSITWEGEGAGQWCRAHLSMAEAKLQGLFSFHLLFYYMAEAPSSTFNPRRLLQLQSSSPLHPSSTSIHLANFIPRCLSISKPHRCAISSPSPLWCSQCAWCCYC
jgi:hypothetical protein